MKTPTAATRGPVSAKVADLRPWARNPRKIRPERLQALARSLEAEREMLDARPLIALPDGTVIAGNQRLAAAKALGWDEIPTVFVDLDEARAAEWALRDNRGFGEDDEEQLADMLRDLELWGRDLELTGFDSADIDRLLAANGRVTDPDEAPRLPKKPRSKAGEVYELGPHRLMCGDATDAEQVRALFAPPTHHALDLVDAIWTDPPYGVSYVGKTADALTIEGDDAEGVRTLLEAALRAIQPGLAPHARFYVAAPAGPRHSDFLGALDDVGWRLHQTLVWVKQRAILGHSDYHYQHEPILYDPFGGSGSTLIACERLGRHARLMEIDPAYCDVIRDRYAAFVGG